MTRYGATRHACGVLLAVVALTGCSRQDLDDGAGPPGAPQAGERTAMASSAPPPPSTKPPTPASSSPEAQKPVATPREEPAQAPAPRPAPPPAAAQATRAPAKDVYILKGAPIGGVRLEHKLHVERAGNTCEVCHHASRPEKPATAAQQACSDCHTKTATPPMKTRYQAAFHDPTAKTGLCIDCHRRQNAKSAKAPIKCVECHDKKNI